VRHVAAPRVYDSQSRRKVSFGSLALTQFRPAAGFRSQIFGKIIHFSILEKTITRNGQYDQASLFFYGKPLSFSCNELQANRSSFYSERYHESLDNDIPADVHDGKHQEIITLRQQLKPRTLNARKNLSS